MATKVLTKVKKAKAKPKKVKKNKFEQKVDELDAKVPFRICHVCDREARDLVWARLNKYRCRDCAPGSPDWLDWYDRLPKNSPERTEFGDRIYKHWRKN